MPDYDQLYVTQHKRSNEIHAFITMIISDSSRQFDKTLVLFVSHISRHSFSIHTLLLGSSSSISGRIVCLTSLDTLLMPHTEQYYTLIYGRRGGRYSAETGRGEVALQRGIRGQWVRQVRRPHEVGRCHQLSVRRTGPVLLVVQLVQRSE